MFDNAYEELLAELKDGEVIEGIVFGGWGDWDNHWNFNWDENYRDNIKGKWQRQYHEPDPPPVPFDKRLVVLSEEQARPYMMGWTFTHGLGVRQSYAAYIWTNQRLIWVSAYDGSTLLDSAPRNPIDCIPVMSGGG